jgi:hypothetical protein
MIEGCPFAIGHLVIGRPLSGTKRNCLCKMLFDFARQFSFPHSERRRAVRIT